MKRLCRTADTCTEKSALWPAELIDLRLCDRANETLVGLSTEKNKHPVFADLSTAGAGVQIQPPTLFDQPSTLASTGESSDSDS